MQLIWIAADLIKKHNGDYILQSEKEPPFFIKLFLILDENNDP